MRSGQHFHAFLFVVTGEITDLFCLILIVRWTNWRSRVSSSLSFCPQTFELSPKKKGPDRGGSPVRLTGWTKRQSGTDYNVNIPYRLYLKHRAPSSLAYGILGRPVGQELSVLCHHRVFF